MQVFKGALAPKIDIRDYKYKPAGVTKETFPHKFECGVVVPIKDQGNVNSCVAHVAAEIEEYYNKLQHNTTEPLSVGFIYGCRYDYKGEGMYLRDALKTLKEKGIATNNEFPYNLEVPQIIEKYAARREWKTAEQNKISTYFSIPVNKKNTESSMKRALMQYGPLMVSVPWFDNSLVINAKLTCHPNQEPDGYHCVLVYGWNSQGWLMQNSWGDKWGVSGRAIIPYEYPLEEVWGITDNILNNDIKKKSKSSFMNVIFKAINAILRLFKK
jgi:C1A family cysteine protease